MSRGEWESLLPSSHAWIAEPATASCKNKTSTLLSHFSEEERNHLKVTLKLLQEARMGPF